MDRMNVKCPRCGRLVSFIPFGYSQIAACCGEVISRLSDAERQVEEFLTGPDAAIAEDADIQ
jgi:hypothetical protein